MNNIYKKERLNYYEEDNRFIKDNYHNLEYIVIDTCKGFMKNE